MVKLGQTKREIAAGPPSIWRSRVHYSAWRETWRPWASRSSRACPRVGNRVVFRGLPKRERTMPDLMDRITIDPEIRSGKPIIRDTRITVADVLEYLAGGMTPEEILSDFPALTEEDIRAVLAFAAQRERRLFSVS